MGCTGRRIAALSVGLAWVVVGGLKAHGSETVGMLLLGVAELTFSRGGAAFVASTLLFGSVLALHRTLERLALPPKEIA